MTGVQTCALPISPFYRGNPGMPGLKWVASALASGGNHNGKGKVRMEEERRDGVKVMGGDHGYAQKR